MAATVRQLQRRTCRVVAAVLLVCGAATHAETFQGLTIAPEERCAPYDRHDYPYPQAVELRIIEELGGIYGPYTGTCFESRRETDIEHMVATSEAHDSGLCRASPEVRAAFARDTLNLTLAAPFVNRRQKGARDVSEWLPSHNVCWYVWRTLEVRRKYRLTIDRGEAMTAERVLSGCRSTALQRSACSVDKQPQQPLPAAPRSSTLRPFGPPLRLVP